MTGRKTPTRSSGKVTFGRPEEPWRNLEEEKARAEARAAYEAKLAIDRGARAIAEARAEKDATASALDVLSSALFDVIADHVFDALHRPDFAEALRARGFVVVPVVERELPEPPLEWLQDGIDLFGAEGTPANLVERLDQMWMQAFRAGWDARAAGECGTDGR